MAHLTQSHQRLLESIYDTHGVWKAKVRLDLPHMGEIERITWEADTLQMLAQLEEAGLLTAKQSGVLRTVRMGDRVVGEFAADRHITRAGMFAVLEDQQR